QRVELQQGVVVGPPGQALDVLDRLLELAFQVRHRRPPHGRGRIPARCRRRVDPGVGAGWSIIRSTAAASTPAPPPRPGPPPTGRRTRPAASTAVPAPGPASVVALVADLAAEHPV